MPFVKPEIDAAEQGVIYIIPNYFADTANAKARPTRCGVPLMRRLDARTAAAFAHTKPHRGRQRNIAAPRPDFRGGIVRGRMALWGTLVQALYLARGLRAFPGYAEQQFRRRFSCGH